MKYVKSLVLRAWKQDLKLLIGSEKKYQMSKKKTRREELGKNLRMILN
jgi:hypothetical protein